MIAKHGGRINNVVPDDERNVVPDRKIQANTAQKTLLRTLLARLPSAYKANLGHKPKSEQAIIIR